MKVGDLVKFKRTGAIASIVNIENRSALGYGDFVSIYVADGTLKHTPSSGGYTGMSMKMLKRTAEVINE